MSTVAKSGYVRALAEAARDAGQIIASLDSARRRGAKIFGEVCGYGAATDSHHLTQPQPEGSAALDAPRAGLAAAGNVFGWADQAPRPV